MLLNDRTPANQFDVTGPFDSSDQIPSPDELHRMALDTRPDLKAAIQAVDNGENEPQACDFQWINRPDV